MQAATFDTRYLLWRISIIRKYLVDGVLVTGRFDRSLALEIGAITPSISHVGECLDQLIGPWLEVLDSDYYRVSPLATHFGRDMLSDEIQRRVHRTIAHVILERRTVDVLEFNSAIVHAMAGKLSDGLTSIAYRVLRTSTFLSARGARCKRCHHRLCGQGCRWGRPECNDGSEARSRLSIRSTISRIDCFRLQ